MSETNYFRLIEAYFNGNISPAEKAMLEAKISSDPLVKAEFDLQKNIVNGISNARKAELKARLASIELPTQVGVFAGGASKWLAGTIAGVTIFSSVLYWSISSFDQPIKPLDLKQIHMLEFSETPTPDYPVLQMTEEKVENEEKPVAKSVKSAEENIEKTEKTAKVEPQALMSYDDDKVFTNKDNQNLENIASREVDFDRADKTEVEFHESLDNKNAYHYRYFNSKLYLYGDFNEMPYQIIELNDKGEKQLFLSHNKEIFVIQDNTTEVTELSKLKDDILKLEIQLIVEE